jgi:signal transduction histidine kinase
LKSIKIRYQAVALFVSTMSVILVGILGVYAYLQTPSIFIDRTLPFTELDTSIIQIEDQPIDKTFLYRFPEFNSQKEERQWWQAHQAMYEAIKFKQNIHVLYNVDNSSIKEASLLVKHLSLVDALKDMGLVYLVSAIFLLSAISVYRKHRTLAGQVLCYFLLSCSLFLTSAAPVACRSITLTPGYFKLFMTLNYVANGGLVTMVHFSLIFPAPKKHILDRNMLVFAVIYGYVVVTTVLYVLKITAFNTSYPFMFFWVALMLVSFIHSIITEKDAFFKKQITLTLAAPMIVVVFFVLFESNPALLGTTLMRFTYFALLSSILPISLSSAMDNLRLYTEKIGAERRYYKEKEEIRQDLHDNTLNNLAKIAMLSEMSLQLIQKGETGVEEKLRSIKTYSSQFSKEIRELLYVSDERHNTWSDFSDNLRKIGHDLIQGLGIDFDICFNDDGQPGTPPHPSLKMCLYHIFKEAISNIIKHAAARSINCTLETGNKTIHLEIRDNGKGFDPDYADKNGHGLVNMKNRVAALGGSLTVSSIINEGTHLKVQLPHQLQNTPFG